MFCMQPTSIMIKVIMKPVVILVWACSIIHAMAGCGTSLSAPIVQAAVINDADGVYAIAGVTQDDYDITGAEILVNDTMLSYGIPVVFETETGLTVAIDIPLYAADLSSRIKPGEDAGLIARDIMGYMLYEHTPLVLPGPIDLLEPAAGQVLAVGDDVPMRWSAADGTQGYMPWYAAPDIFNDDEMDDTDDYTGLFSEYLSPETLSATVPAASTVVGPAIFGIDTITGITPDFINEGTDESFFITMSSALQETVITPDEEAVTGDMPSATGTSQGMVIAKEYSKKCNGLRFTIREGDPRQIIAPGQISIGLKLRRFKASVAFVAAYDINGNQYASWTKKRLFKISHKKYNPTFSVSPGTTIVIGTHDASYRGGTYSY